tara:strand:- start:1221 stop:1355 length:135 start_codon:yes stop_codon:yes gene_type:complete
MSDSNLKTVLKFDFGRKGFDKAAMFLIILAAILVLLGVYFVYSF